MSYPTKNDTNSYCLQEYKDITISKLDRKIKSLISYAV